MTSSEIAKNRIENLKKWFDNHSIPTKDKSVISRAINGRMPVGERLARRLEKENGMPDMYLDSKSSELVSIDSKEDYSISSINFSLISSVAHLHSEVQEVIKLIQFDAVKAAQIFHNIPSSTLKILNITGDSMASTFNSGDALFVNTSVVNFEGDGIYVFSYGRGIYVKRLQLIKDAILVISDNKAYKEWEINGDAIDDIIFYGKVMCSQSTQLRWHS
ncbi:S24 family peptidase [Orbus wheelerorum]|uniref:S24 family peptidase n=1 Tax=Orbus wheelerorum TaxID=3074111 RepID=UPI00370D7AC8